MAYRHRGNLWDRIKKTSSIKSFAENFLLNTMAGQKIFLVNPSVPRVFNVSFIEKTCMFRCKMCHYSKKHVRQHYKTSSEMNFDTLKRLVKFIPNDNFFSVDMSAVGETLEFELIAEFISYIKKDKPKVNTIVSTNALLLTENRFLKLSLAGLDSLQMSLFSHTPESHSHVTGTDSFDIVVKNMKRASEIKKAYNLRKPFLQTFILGTQENKHQVQQFVNTWSQYMDNVSVRPLHKRGLHFIPGMSPLYSFDVEEPRYPCAMPWYCTAINSKGDVLPCYHYHWEKSGWEFNFGNINEQSIQNIWASKKFQKFREQHRLLDFSDLPACANCINWSNYTNVWNKHSGRYTHAPLTIADFFTSSPEARGG